MILVSACLVGSNCRYNGGTNFDQNVISKLEGKRWIPVCPEQLGGLQTPRTPAEIQDGDGAMALVGEAKVKSKNGVDVTENFIKGAKETLYLAQMLGATEAILKERSPSCGSCKIYDGSFQGKPKQGSGVAAALLKQHGIIVKSEEDFA